MTNKQQALDTIKSILNENNLSLEELANHLKTNQNQGLKTSIPLLFSYLGGILILGGICLLVSMKWEEMNSLTRLLSTLGTGFITFILALFSLTDSRANKLVTPLFLLAAYLETTGLFVLLTEYFTPTGNWEHGAMFVFGCITLQFGLCFIALERSVLLFISFFSLMSLTHAFLHYCDAKNETNALFLGTIFLIMAFLTNRSKHRSIVPFFYFVTSIIFLGGLFNVCKKGWTEVFFVLGNLSIIYLSIYEKSRTLLVIGILSTFSYISYLTYKHFSGSTGWPIALIGLGVVLCVLSVVGVHLNKRFLSR